MRSIGATALIITVLLAALAATAWATPNQAFTTRTVAVGRFGDIHLKTKAESGHEVDLKTKGESDLYVVENTVAPGGHSGWHTHPGPSLITVKQGTATFYDAEDPTCTPRVYEAGEGAIDVGDGHIHLLRNEGTVDLVTVTVQIIGAGEARRIDAPQPGNCGF